MIGVGALISILFAASDTFLSDAQFQLTYCMSNVHFICGESASLSRNLERKQFGSLRQCALVEDIRIITYDNGFCLLFPPQRWHQFDHTLNPIMSILDEGDGACWATQPGYTYLKIDLDRRQLSPEFLDYLSDDYQVQLNKAKQCVAKNFLPPSRAYPDNPLFSIGSFMNYPDTPRPMRARLAHFRFEL